MSNKKKEERDLSLLGASFGLLGRGFKITMIIMIVSMLIVCIIAEQEAIEKKKNSEQAIRLRIERTKEERTMLDQKIADDRWGAATQYLQNNGDLGGPKPDLNGQYDQSEAIPVAYGKLEPNELLYLKDFYDMCSLAAKAASDKYSIQIPAWIAICAPVVESTGELKPSSDGTVTLPPSDNVVKYYGEDIGSGKKATFKDMTWQDRGLSGPAVVENGNKYHNAIGGDGGCIGVFQMTYDQVYIDGNGDGQTQSQFNTYDACFSVTDRAVKYIIDNYSSAAWFNELSPGGKVLVGLSAHNRGGVAKQYYPPDTMNVWGPEINTFMADQNLYDKLDISNIGQSYDGARVAGGIALASRGWKINAYFKSKLGSPSQITAESVPNATEMHPSLAAAGMSVEHGGMMFRSWDICHTDHANYRYWVGAVTAKYMWGAYTYILGRECGGTYAQAGPSTMQQQGASVGAGQSMGTMMYSTYKDFTTAGASQSSTQNPFTGSNPLDENVFKQWAQSGTKGSGDPRDNAGDHGEQGWKGSFPLIYQSPQAYGGSTKVGTDSQTMAQAGCSVYSLFSCLVGMGYGKTPIPKPKGINPGYSGNGLNSKGVMDIKEFAQACKVAMTADDVRKLGYKVKVGNPTNSEAEWRAIFNDIKNGHPYSANFKDNRAAVIPSYNKRTMQLVSSTDSIVPGGCGHFIPIVNVFTYNGEEYFEVANSCGMTGDKGVKSGVGSEFLCYKVEDFIKNHRGSVGQGVCYTVTGI